MDDFLEFVGKSVAVLLLGLVAFAVGLFFYHFYKELRNPSTLRARFQKWLGSKFLDLETHEKSFPGYDLGSVSRALEALFEERTTHRETIGSATFGSLRQVFEHYRGNGYELKVNALSFERIPVDVDEELSFPSNILWFVDLDLDSGPERCAVLLGAKAAQWQDHMGLDESTPPAMTITVSIACSSKDLATKFFRELESRRRTLSIYRGKFIDPVVDAGGVRTIGFRALRSVDAKSLVLPERVRTLLESSVLRFYAHRATLEKLGIEKKRGILFHGPPGTGKTSVCLWLARELKDFTVCFVSGQRLLYPRELAKMARHLAPTMLVFEDIDLIAEQRDMNGLATVLGELMNQIDGCEPHEEVLFVMNTNSLDRLEPAVRNRPGRVDQIIEIPPPGPEDRKRLIEMFAGAAKLEIGDWERTLDVCRGMTPAMLKEVVKRAVVGAVAQLPDPGEEASPSVILRDADLVLAFEQVRLMRGAPPKDGEIGFQRG